MSVEPLRKRTMTISELQAKTLKVLRQMRRQLNRRAHEEGMSDREFMDQVLAPLEHEIRQDREVLKMNRKSKGNAR